LLNTLPFCDRVLLRSPLFLHFESLPPTQLVEFFESAFLHLVIPLLCSTTRDPQRLVEPEYVNCFRVVCFLLFSFVKCCLCLYRLLPSFFYYVIFGVFIRLDTSRSLQILLPFRLGDFTLVVAYFWMNFFLILF